MGQNQTRGTENFLKMGQKGQKQPIDIYTFFGNGTKQENVLSHKKSFKLLIVLRKNRNGTKGRDFRGHDRGLRNKIFSLCFGVAESSLPDRIFAYGWREANCTKTSNI